MKKLKDFLNRNNISGVEFARILGTTQPRLVKWLSGMGRPGLDHAVKIEELTLGVVKVKDWLKERPIDPECAVVPQPQEPPQLSQ